MIYITGDIHGSAARLSFDNMPFARNWTKKDALIVCGDFGFLFNGTSREETILHELAQRPYHILFVDGNRENFDLLEKYPVVEWRGGKARRIRRNIYHLMRGQVFEIAGSTIFTMGGGDSIDKGRRYPGVDWWPREMPSQEEYDEAKANLAAHGMRVDYVISHTAPECTMQQLFSDHDNERPLNDFLQWVRDHVDFRRWYFGHLHMDIALEEHLYAVFLAVRELETGDQI